MVLAATSGFEIAVAAALAGAGLPLAVIDPRQIRTFARAIGRLAETDRLDAEAIALFGERTRPQALPIADAARRAQAELVACRRQLVEMIGDERRSLHVVQPSIVACPRLPRAVPAIGSLPS